MDALPFLEKLEKPKFKSERLYVLHGDEDFLKRQIVLGLRRALFGPDGDDLGFSTCPGDKAEFAAVHDELQTLPFLCPYRLVVVENADPFVTKNRSILEKYVTRPAEKGVLVLDVRNWPATTKLAKLVAAAGTIVCKAPAAYKMPEWCARWATSHYQKELPAPAARLLVDLVGPEMGQLDQELAKLAVYVGKSAQIHEADVDQLVGSSRTEKAFKIFDAIGAGRAAEALDVLDRLLQQGDDPLYILGAFSLQLRRLAQAARLSGQGMSLAAALDRAGIQPWARQACEQQLRHLGRQRAEQLYDWLLEVDLGLKGGSQLSPRTLLERLVLRLAAKAGA